MIRKLMVAALVLVEVFVAPYTFAESNSYKVLLDKIYDVRQLVNTGVDYNEYKKQATELKLALGRFERDRGLKPDISSIVDSNHSPTDGMIRNELIRGAAGIYILAADNWKREIDSLSKGYAPTNFDNLKHENWKVADEQLEELEQLNKGDNKTKKKIRTEWGR